MAPAIGEYGFSTLLPLAKFVGVIYFACFIHIVVVYGGLVRTAGGMSAWQFFKAVFDAQVAGVYHAAFGRYRLLTEQ